MRLKRSSEGGMSISHVDMEIPEGQVYNRAPTIQEERPVKKRAQSAKPGPTDRFRYNGNLKNLNKTKQEAFVDGGRDMIIVQSEVNQQNQDMVAMNARINTLKRKAERAEKKQRRIEREQQNVQMASANKMEKSQSRVNLTQQRQEEAEIKRQKIQEEKRRRSESKKRAREEQVYKQVLIKRTASVEKQQRKAKLEEEKQRDYERRMRNYAKIRAQKDEYNEKHKNDEVEYVGRIKHMYNNDRKMKKKQAEINQQMLRNLQEEERKCWDKLQDANQRTNYSEYQLNQMKYGNLDQDEQHQNEEEVEFEVQQNMSQSASKNQKASKNKRKQTMIQSSTTSNLQKSAAMDNGYNTLQVQQNPQQNNQLNERIRLNKPIVRDQAQSQPTQVLKEEMVLNVKSSNQLQQQQIRNGTPSQYQQDQQPYPNHQQVAQIQMQQSAISVQSQQTPSAPPMKANMIKEEIKEQERSLQMQTTPVKNAVNNQQQNQAQVQSAVKQADPKAVSKQVQNQAQEEIQQQKPIVRQKLDISVQEGTKNVNNIQQQRIMNASQSTINSQRTAQTVVQQNAQSLNIVTPNNGQQTIKQEVKQAVVNNGQQKK